MRTSMFSAAGPGHARTPCSTAYSGRSAQKNPPAGTQQRATPRITLGRERDDARELVAAHLDQLDTGWREHLTIL